MAAAGAVAKLTKRLAELDDERGRVLIALKVLNDLEPGVQSHGEKLAHKALARVNGHPVAPTREAKRGRTARMDRIIAWLSKGTPKPVTVRDVIVGVGGDEPRDRVFGVLANLTKRTKFHGKLVKKVGTKWLWIGDSPNATHATAKAAKKTGGMKKARPARPGEVKDAIIAFLKARSGPTSFIEIRDALRREGVISKDSTSGRSVSVTLRTALTHKKLVKLTADGWIYTGPE